MEVVEITTCQVYPTWCTSSSNSSNITSLNNNNSSNNNNSNTVVLLLVDTAVILRSTRILRRITRVGRIMDTIISALFNELICFVYLGHWRFGERIVDERICNEI